jgi:hypothetical protein
VVACGGVDGVQRRWPWHIGRGRSGSSCTPLQAARAEVPHHAHHELASGPQAQVLSSSSFLFLFFLIYFCFGFSKFEEKFKFEQIRNL